MRRMAKVAGAARRGVHTALMTEGGLFAGNASRADVGCDVHFLPSAPIHPQGVRMFSLRQRLKTALVLALGTLSIATAFSGCAPTEKIPDYIPYPDLQQVGLRKVWERQIVVASHEHIENVWRVGDSLYVTTNLARLIRIEAASGVKVWDKTVGEGDSSFHCPTETADGKHLIVASKGEVLGLDKSTGEVVSARGT